MSTQEGEKSTYKTLRVLQKLTDTELLFPGIGLWYDIRAVDRKFVSQRLGGISFYIQASYNINFWHNVERRNPDETWEEDVNDLFLDHLQFFLGFGVNLF